MCKFEKSFCLLKVQRERINKLRLSAVHYPILFIFMLWLVAGGGGGSGPGRPGSLGWCRLVNLGEDDIPGLGTAA